MRCHPPRILIAALFVFTIIFFLIPIASALASEAGTANASVVLREESSKSSKALQTIPQGDEVSVLRASGDWYRVRYGSFTGYVMKRYIDLSVGSVIQNQNKINDLGDAPGPLYIGDEGSDVKKLQQALKILGFYDLRADGIYGSGTTTAVAMFQQSSSLESDGIAGKQTVTAIFGSCAGKADITVSGRDTQTADSTSGSSADSTDSRKNAVSCFSEIGSAPSPTKEGDSGKDVVKLQQALSLLGYFSGTIDGDYGEMTKNAVIRFQKNRDMNADGVAGAATIRVLFAGTSDSASSSSSSASSSSSEKYETLVLDWFADNVSSVIPKGAKFVIKDVRTGKTFNAVRWSGVNHLDAEPATSDDTAVFKSIYHGVWSWNRRPILILYKDKVYAASMNGMPHGTTTIDNDFDGHFCIHFKNSKTHDTEVVDPDHQAAVAVASKATW
jgi:peptidoglycan hydrolase-like protein with peptidoglycan-binding domain